MRVSRPRAAEAGRSRRRGDGNWQATPMAPKARPPLCQPEKSTGGMDAGFTFSAKFR